MEGRGGEGGEWREEEGREGNEGEGEEWRGEEREVASTGSERFRS